ncbi:hypothetical protein L1047_15000 [Synechococcus sp. Nb3U1]|uniref:hypothetical protein n=1 Tax=Synechococcus sp. Nb3U1 TaxID=1914529 RepID=UPI001F45E608|nr:hypothetical protein [Synechococcus sp. Nb3U1]MCF2972502.1 hypothetical protein [Synechococcus sp. Nb3U1]
MKFRVFNIGSNLNVTINGLTITNGSSGYGSGIFAATGSTLTVNNSTLSNNSADSDGGIRLFTTFSKATVSDSNLSGNTATTSGGAISNLGGTVILNSNKFGTAVPSSTANVASTGPNVANLNGNTGSGNDPSTCDASSGSY